MDDMVLQVSARDGEGVDGALVRLEVPMFGGGEVLGQMSRSHKKKATADRGIHDEKENYHYSSLSGDHGWKEPCCRQGGSPGQVNNVIDILMIIIDIIVVILTIIIILMIMIVFDIWLITRAGQQTHHCQFHPHHDPL